MHKFMTPALIWTFKRHGCGKHWCQRGLFTLLLHCWVAFVSRLSATRSSRLGALFWEFSSLREGSNTRSTNVLDGPQNAQTEADPRFSQFL